MEFSITSDNCQIEYARRKKIPLLFRDFSFAIL